MVRQWMNSDFYLLKFCRLSGNKFLINPVRIPTLWKQSCQVQWYCTLLTLDTVAWYLYEKSHLSSPAICFISTDISSDRVTNRSAISFSRLTLWMNWVTNVRLLEYCTCVSIGTNSCVRVKNHTRFRVRTHEGLYDKKSFTWSATSLTLWGFDTERKGIKCHPKCRWYYKYQSAKTWTHLVSRYFSTPNKGSMH